MTLITNVVHSIIKSIYSTQTESYTTNFLVATVHLKLGM